MVRATIAPTGGERGGKTESRGEREAGEEERGADK